MTSNLSDETPWKLYDVEALLRSRFPHHKIRCVRVGTHYRFVLEKAGESRMFGVTDTVMACHCDAASVAGAVLDADAVTRQLL
jgi:hypothetical protein